MGKQIKWTPELDAIVIRECKKGTPREDILNVMFRECHISVSYDALMSHIFVLRQKGNLFPVIPRKKYARKSGTYPRGC